MINRTYSEMIALSEKIAVDFFGDVFAIEHFDVQTKTFMSGTEYPLVICLRSMSSSSAKSNAVLCNALNSIFIKTFANAIHYVVTAPA